MTETPNYTAPIPDIETLLQQQTLQLDAVFHQLLARSIEGNFSYTSMKTALRAQSQCQATARTLKMWKRQGKEKS